MLIVRDVFGVDRARGIKNAFTRLYTLRAGARVPRFVSGFAHGSHGISAVWLFYWEVVENKANKLLKGLRWRLCGPGFDEAAW
jgi:hypothetical protein